MNNTFFSFKRFWLLLRNDLIINYKSYLLTIVGVFIVGFIFIYLQLPGEKAYSESLIGRVDGYKFLFDNERYRDIFIMSLFALDAFIGLAFPALSDKVRTSNYLLAPASTFEKLFVQFIIRVVSAIVVFLAIFWLDAQLARIVAIGRYTGESSHAIEIFQYSEMFNLSTKLLSVSIFLSLGVYLFSIRVFFSKYGLIKSIISIPIIFLLVTGIIIFASHLFYPTETIGMSIYWEGINATIDRAQTNNLDILAVNLIWIVLLPLGYYKLKEKQL